VICRNAISGDTLRLDAEAVLLATGRKPNTESLNLQAAGIQTTNRGAIEVDSKLGLRLVQPDMGQRRIDEYGISHCFPIVQAPETITKQLLPDNTVIIQR